MKNLITHIIIAIVCFTSGYVLYPSINDTEFKAILTSNAKDENNLKEDIPAVTAPKTSLTLITNSGNSSSSRMSAMIKEQNFRSFKEVHVNKHSQHKAEF